MFHAVDRAIIHHRPTHYELLTWKSNIFKLDVVKVSFSKDKLGLSLGKNTARVRLIILADPVKHQRIVLPII